MTKFEGCYLTNAGRAMVYAYGLTDITFTKAVTGSGVYTSKEDISDMAELKEARQEFRFDSFTENSEDCTVSIKFKIDNVGLETGYQLSEIGIYAETGDGEEKLYCVAYAMSDHTEEVPANDGAITYYMAVTIDTVVSSDANVSVIYSEEHEWTKDYVDELIKPICDEMETCLHDDGDSKNLTVTFDSVDEESPDTWTNVSVMKSGEAHKSLFGKISTMFRNVRYLYKLLGTTDISKFGGGTVTGAIKDLEDSKPGDATQSAHGLMTAADKKKLDGIAAGANAYTHPSSAAGAKTSGLYKITTDASGHVTAVTPVVKADITALGIPGADTNTTYGDATQSAHGLMTAADKKKLDGIAAGANAYTHPSTHAASMITQDATHRFVSDTEKTTWNNKLNKSDVTQSAAVTTAGQKALDAIEKNASIEGTLANQLSKVNSNMSTYIEYFISNTAEDGWINLKVNNDEFVKYLHNGGITTLGLKKVFYNIGIYSTAIQNISLEAHMITKSGDWSYTFIYNREICQEGYHYFTGAFPINLTDDLYIKFHIYGDLSNMTVIDNSQDSRIYVTS